MSTRVNLGSSSSYSGGFTLPEGDYALYFDVRLHAFTKKDGTPGQEGLGVMLTAYPLAGGAPLEQFYRMGSKAHLAFMPDPDTPAWNGTGSTGIIPIPGAPAGSLARESNWDLLRSSFIDCDPAVEDVLGDDVSNLDGIWAHMKPVPEPESRKRMGAATGEVEQERADRGPQMVALCVEIRDDGKPWENGGGLPEGAGEVPEPEPVKPKPAPRPGPRPVAKPAAKPVAAKPGPKPVAKPKPAAKAAPAEAEGEVDLTEAAQAAAAAVIEKNPNGGSLIVLRTGGFAFAKKTYGDAVAQQVIDGFFATGKEEEAGTILESLGYAVSGRKFAPAG